MSLIGSPFSFATARDRASSYVARLQQTVMAFLRSFKQRERREYLIAGALFLALFLLVTSVKVARIDEFQGDSAGFFQGLQGIVHRGVPVSQVFASAQAFSFDSGLTTMPAAEVAKNALAPSPIAESNLISFHLYLILYPIAALVWLFPPDIVVLTLYALSYVGIVVLVYFILRGTGIPVIGATLFCLFVISHPAWSSGLLDGQFYPDRLFVLAGFVLMYLASRDGTSRAWQIAAAVLCAMIDEKAALIAGMFLVAYAVLYWRKPNADRMFKLLLGLALLCYGLIVVKFVIQGNPYYSTFLPTSIGGIVANFELPGFAARAGLFLLVSAPFLAIAFFEYRAALIALLVMLPNIIGNIGGAEKLGWSTHYHSEYLPALVWATLLGYTAFYRRMAAQKRTAVVYVSTAILVLLVSMIDPFSFPKLSISPSNIGNAFFPKLEQWSSSYLGPAAPPLRATAEHMREVVPEGSVVSTVEAGMPILYHGRTLEFFPVDIDHADYAVLGAVQAGGKITYDGVISFLGPAEQGKVMTVVLERMRRDGYDLAHPALFPVFGLAVVKRVRAAGPPLNGGRA